MQPRVLALVATFLTLCTLGRGNVGNPCGFTTPMLAASVSLEQYDSEPPICLITGTRENTTDPGVDTDKVVFWPELDEFTLLEVDGSTFTPSSILVLTSVEQARARIC